MKKILAAFTLIFFTLSSNAAFSLELTGENAQDLQFSPDEQFAREEAVREQKKASLEVEKGNAELEALRLEVEGALAEDVKRAQKETDLMRQELAKELLILQKEAEKEAEVKRKELQKEEEKALKEALKALDQTTQELDKDLKRIKLRPPKP